MYRIAVLLAVVSLCRGAVGSEDPAVSPQHLQFMEPYIGTWFSESTLEEDTLLGRKGDRGTSSITWRWVYGRSAIEWEWVFDFAGKRAGTKGLMTWDVASNRLVGAGVGSLGGFIRVTSRATNPFCVLAEFALPDGQAASQVETFTLSSDDSLLLRATERKGMPAVEDSPAYTFTRVKPPTLEAGTHHQNLKAMQWVVGEWVSDTEMKEDVPGFGAKGDLLQFGLSVDWGLAGLF